MKCIGFYTDVTTKSGKTHFSKFCQAILSKVFSYHLFKASTSKAYYELGHLQSLVFTSYIVLTECQSLHLYKQIVTLLIE